MADAPPDLQRITDQLREALIKLNSTDHDAGAMLMEQKKNIEAMFLASQIASNGAHAVLQRQFELFRDTSERLLRMFSEAELTSQERAELVKMTLERAFVGTREVTDLVAKASEATFAVAQDRMTEGLAQFRKPTK